MKTAFNILPFVAIICLLWACSSAKEQKPQTEPLPANEAVTENQIPEDFTGIVTEIQPGKDGYTARIKVATGEIYYATISRANLTDPATYRSVEIGDTLNVTGDYWQMENQHHVTVRKIK